MLRRIPKSLERLAESLTVSYNGKLTHTQNMCNRSLRLNILQSVTHGPICIPTVSGWPLGRTRTQKHSAALTDDPDLG